jgi:hypothetical protein
MNPVLIIVACLAGEPAKCQDFPQITVTEYGDAMTVQQCSVMGGQIVAARWLAEHPDYVLKAIRCGQPQGDNI